VNVCPPLTPALSLNRVGAKHPLAPLGRGFWCGGYFFEFALYFNTTPLTPEIFLISPTEPFSLSLIKKSHPTTHRA
ncbi:hypothetical protein ACVGXO_00145, partial [Enterobacter hormaechei]